MRIKSSTRFMIGLGVIVFAAIGSMSLFFYEYVRNFYIQESYQKTDLVLGHIDATMEYIRDELRPKMFHVLPKDDFVREAMSTSFVNKGVMSRFTKLFPVFIYRRVALNPMNPQNRADALEAGFIRKFAGNPSGKLEWKGLISKDGQDYFIHVKGVVMEKACAVCHGKPSDSPKSLLARYGRVHGHNWPLGQVVGLESIAIPMDAAFYKIRQDAFAIFLAGLTGMVALFVLLNYFYYMMTQRPLQKASAFFKSIVSGEKGLDVRFDAKGRDEILELADSFNRLIDHLRASQQELMESERKYRRIFEGSKDTIILADRAGLILDINNSGLDLLNFYDRRDVVRRLRIHDLFVSEESRGDFFELLEEMGFAKDYESLFRRGNGAEIHVLITATCRKGDDGEAEEYECLIKNITERKKLELQLRQADKLASIGQLAAGVAHEINNPLSIVMGYAKLLREDAADAMLKEDLDIIYNNSYACKKIIEDLLNFSRQTRTCAARVDIRETIESVVSVVENNFAEGNVTIARDYDPLVPQVTIDADKIRQVCMNLIMNAYQAMDGGGRITVSTRSDADHGGFYILCTDTGSGIAAHIRERIFDPFFTTKEPGQGTGLGLTVSYGIIKEHHGDITFETQIGAGSVFRIWLPLGVGEDETSSAHCG